MMKKLSLLSLLVGIACCMVSPALGGQVDEELAEKYLVVLSQDPMNELVFEKLVYLYTKAQKKIELGNRLRRALEADRGAVVEAIVLARLLARDNKPKEALDALSTLLASEQPDVRVLLLAARLKDASAQHQEALALLVRALPLAEDEDLKKAVLTSKADLHLRLRQREKAVADWQALVRMEGLDFQLKLDTAETMSAKGFDNEAAEVYQLLIQDPEVGPEKRLELKAKRAQILSRRGRAKEAREVYEGIFAVITPVHWMWEGTLEAAITLAQRTDQVTETRAFLQKKSQANPDDPAWVHAEARLLEREGDSAEAITVLEKCLAKWPKNSTAIAKLATLYRKAHLKSKQRVLFEKLAKSFPDDPEPVFEHAALVLSEREKEEGVKLLAKAVALSPEKGPALARAARAYRENLYYEEALGAFQEALKLSPYDLELRRGAGSLLFLLERDAEVGRFLLAPYGKERPLAPGEAIEVAQYLRERQRIPEALAVLRASVKRAPAHFDLRLALADVESELGDFASAKAGLTRALNLAETGSQRLSILTQLKALCQKYERMPALVAFLQDHLKKEPDHLEWTLYLAEVYVEMDDATKAERLYQKLGETFGEDVSFQKALARFYELTNKKLEALELYRGLTAQDPATSALHWLKVAELLMGMERNFEAKLVLQQVFHQGVESADAHLSLASKFDALGEKARAKECLARAFALAPDNTNVAEQLQAVYRDTSDLLAFADLAQRRLASQDLSTEERGLLKRELLAAAGSRAAKSLAGAASEDELWDLVEAIERTYRFADSAETRASFSIMLALAKNRLGRDTQALVHLTEIRNQYENLGLLMLDCGICIDMKVLLSSLASEIEAPDGEPAAPAQLPEAMEPLSPPLKKLWGHELKHTGFAFGIMPEIHGDRVYLQDNVMGLIQCLDKGTGKLVWETTITPDVPSFTGRFNTPSGRSHISTVRSRIAVDEEGVVYVAARRLWALSPQGSVRWKSVSIADASQAPVSNQFSRPAVSNPVVGRDLIYVYSPTRRSLLAFSRKSGRAKWATRFSAEPDHRGPRSHRLSVPFPSLALRRGRLYALDGYLSVLDARDGHFVWGTGETRTTQLSVGGAPSGVMARPVYSGRSARFYRPHRHSPIRNLACYYTELLVDETAVYLGAHDSSVVKIPLDTPFSERWRVRGQFYGHLIDLGQRLASVGHGNNLSQLDKEAGTCRTGNLTFPFSGSWSRDFPMQMGTFRGLLYVASMTELAQMNPYTAKVTWQEPLTPGASGGAAATGSSSSSATASVSVSVRPHVTAPVLISTVSAQPSPSWHHRSPVGNASPGGVSPLVVEDGILYILRANPPALEAWKATRLAELNEKPD